MIVNGNTWIYDLKVDDKVIEYHKPSGLILVSTITDISNGVITVKRNDDSYAKYSMDSAMIIYEYGTKIADYYLQQYVYPTEGTPKNPEPLVNVKKVSSINYEGNTYNTYTDVTIAPESLLYISANLVPASNVDQVGEDSVFNQSNVSISRNGDTITITGNLDELKSYASSDPSQGTHKWIAIDIDTGEPTIDGISIDGQALSNADIEDASSLGLPAGHIVYWAKADVIDTTPRSFLFTAAGKATVNIFFKFESLS